VLGALSLLVLTLAAVGLYGKHLAGAWRRIYVITAVLALYFNCFVLVAQSFQKISALHALAPTGSEPPFAIAQLIVMIAFVAWGILAVKRFPGSAGMGTARTGLVSSAQEIGRGTKAS